MARSAEAVSCDLVSSAVLWLSTLTSSLLLFHLQRGCVVQAPSGTARPPCIPGQANTFSLMSLPVCKVSDIHPTEQGSVGTYDAEGAPAPRAAGKGEENVMFHSVHQLG